MKHKTISKKDLILMAQKMEREALSEQRRKAVINEAINHEKRQFLRQ